MYLVLSLVMWRLKKHGSWGAWVAQLVGHPTFDRGSGHDLIVPGFEPGVGLCTDSAESAWDSLSLFLPLPAHILSLSLSLSK